jgi:beta-carotene ketolase (CrtW type)
LIGLSGKGLMLAAAILLGWLVSLFTLLAVDLHGIPPGMVVLAVLLRSFLQTGLFIVGHDAMHRVLLPSHRRCNDLMGSLALGLYGALSYGRCFAKHHRHHRNPGGQRDPDFHGRGVESPLLWYCRFMAGYLSLPQMTGLVACWGLLLLVALAETPTAVQNLLLFCTLPLLLSSLQLFLVGTYLPHRHSDPSGSGHHAISLALPEWLSLLACYHFGYHWEHHEYPGLAWFQLPKHYRSHRQLP